MIQNAEHQTDVAHSALAHTLDQHTAEGVLFQVEGDRVRCMACAHRCLIAPGKRGICKVRFNTNNHLRVPYGYVAGLQCDPVEKKPFFHVYPGSNALTFGMLGCDFHCSYCQNWITSQALRDQAALAGIRLATPRQIVTAGRESHSRLVVSSYNEPLISAEWAVDIFKAAAESGMACAMVSNGHATPEALEFLRPWLAALKIDLKTFNDKNYRALGGNLQPVLDAIKNAHLMGMWVEVVTLLVPGFNDGEAELHAMADYIASVSRDIPWHVTAFHPDYHMTDARATTTSDLTRAAIIGQAAGLHYVYAGNLPGHVGPWENTLCPSCKKVLIERLGYTIKAYRLTASGKCPGCSTTIPGLWPAEQSPTGAALSGLESHFNRMPRPL